MVSFRYKWISLVAALGSWYCSSQFYVVADPQVVNAVDPIIALPVADQPTQAIPVEPPVAKPVQLPELPPLAPMAEARPISAPVLTKKQAPPSLTFRRKKSPANRLLLSEVMEPLSRQYPPYLAALIERDIAMGRLRTAQGVFDVEAYAKVFSNAAGFYEATTQDIGFEQYLGTHGSTIFGGYKRTDGFLPDYYHERRTNAGGTPYLGVKLPLMRDGSIDKKRASIMKAKLQKQLAEPLIRKQSIAFSKAAMNAYFAWLSAGQRLQLAEELLQIATDRESAIETQIKKGMSAPLLAKENRQLVVSREIATVHANREFEVASIALSLFYRDSNDEGIVPGRSRLPAMFPASSRPGINLKSALRMAMVNRPEIREYELELQKLNVDSRLFRNQLLPYLDSKAEIDQSVGQQLYKDKGEFELKLGLEFRVPVQRNEAKGKLQENQAKIQQVALKARFAADKISAETRNALVVLNASHQQIEKTVENAELATWLFDAERSKFELGSTDLLSVQFRERAVLEARLLDIKAREDYFKAIADTLAAVGADFSKIGSIEALGAQFD